MKFLVVDDDFNIRQLVSIHLTKQGYKVITANNAEEALLLLEESRVDLAIVDVMMPGMNGFQLTRCLTEELFIPVILLTARGQIEDKEKGYLAGTEDYIVKPFEPQELLFRMAVVLRRMDRSVQSVLEIGNVQLDHRSFEMRIGKETMLMPMKEFELLSLMFSYAPKVVTRSFLMEEVWGDSEENLESTLNTHINRIRDRLKRHEANVEIQTVRGVGYKIEVLV